MTRRSLLALFAVGPLARWLPLPSPPPTLPTTLPLQIVDEIHEHKMMIDVIEVTCFGDTNQVYMPRVRAPR